MRLANYPKYFAFIPQDFGKPRMKMPKIYSDIFVLTHLSAFLYSSVSSGIAENYKTYRLHKEKIARSRV
jgi:hypothetical protein